MYVQFDCILSPLDRYSKLQTFCDNWKLIGTSTQLFCDYFNFQFPLLLQTAPLNQFIIKVLHNDEKEFE